MIIVGIEGQEKSYRKQSQCDGLYKIKIFRIMNINDIYESHNAGLEMYFDCK